MYPVPWVFPTVFSKTRSKSPKKLKSKKRHSGVDIVTAECKDKSEMSGSVHLDAMTAVTDETAAALSNTKNDCPVPRLQMLAAASEDRLARAAVPYLRSSAGPFSSQLDEIARQAALGPRKCFVQPPGVELTTIRNVSAQNDCTQALARNFHTVPSRRRQQRHMGNGLYGGRGNIGMPLFATAPFPMPIPPMGRPIEQDRISRPIFETTIGSQVCSTVQIDKAAEYSGIQACNTCEPDH